MKIIWKNEIHLKLFLENRANISTISLFRTERQNIRKIPKPWELYQKVNFILELNQTRIILFILLYDGIRNSDSIKQIKKRIS